MVLDNRKSSNPARTQTLDHSACGKSIHWLHYPNSLASKFINQNGKIILTYYTLPCFNMSCNENSCIIYDNWCFKIGLLRFFSFNYVLWSHIFGDSMEWKRLFTTQKKVIRIMAKALERKLSGSLFKPFSTAPTCQWTYTIVTVS